LIENLAFLINADLADHLENFAESIRKYLPNAPGQTDIIVTSRQRDWHNTKVIQIGSLDINEAINVINSGLKLDNGDDVKKLATTVGCFPLSIYQAVAYIGHQNQCGKDSSIHDYIELYNTQDADLDKLGFLGTDLPTNHYTRTTFNIWNVTYTKIIEDLHNTKNRKCIKRLISIIPYIGNQGISLKW